jgi:hypothetical protein
VAGPFWFAWVAEGTEFDAEAHAVEDESVFAFELSHTEGEFPTLVLDVVNPRIGLLNDTREQWAWFSHGEGSSVEPLFYGRLVGVPQELQDEVVRLEFRAKPVDYEAQKETLAETLRVSPYWDPIWIAEDARLDPDTVLESRTQLWHIDRVTHAVTVSDIIQGEGGTLDIAGGFFYDSLSVTYSTPPGRACTVKAQAVWQQQAVGEIDITDQFPPYIESFTIGGVIDDWPDDDTSIGGGWRFKTSSWRPYYITTVTGYPYALNTLRAFDTSTGSRVEWRPGRIVAQNMVAAYEAEREYVETLELTITADVQPLLTDAGEDETITLDVSAEVDQLSDPPEESGSDDLLMPIRTRLARRYFQTARGQQSVDYLVCLARAALTHRARAVEITLEIPFDDGADLSCRKMVTVADDRLPGGEATGKVKGYSLTLNGDTGDAICRLTLGVAVGNGGSVSAAAGTPSYVEAGVLEDGIQVMTGQTREVVAGTVAVDDFSGLAINDDGVDWANPTPESVIEAITVYNDASVQEAFLNTQLGGRLAVDAWEISTHFNTDVFTEVEVDLVDAKGGPFETTFAVGASLLKLPKQIDLEAEAA